MVPIPPICNRFGVLHGADEILWGSWIFMIVVSACFYGAPGEIRTPDLVVRSHTLENALNATNTEISLLRLSQTILSFREFYYYFEEFLYSIWEDNGATTVGLSL